MATSSGPPPSPPPSPPPPSDDSDDDGGGGGENNDDGGGGGSALSTPAIAGIAVGSAVGVLVAVAAAWCMMRKKTAKAAGVESRAAV